jgi:hypothetical protein
MPEIEKEGGFFEKFLIFILIAVVILFIVVGILFSQKKR